MSLRVVATRVSGRRLATARRPSVCSSSAPTPGDGRPEDGSQPAPRDVAGLLDDDPRSWEADLRGSGPRRHEEPDLSHPATADRRKCHRDADRPGRPARSMRTMPPARRGVRTMPGVRCWTATSASATPPDRHRRLLRRHGSRPRRAPHRLREEGARCWSPAPRSIGPSCVAGGARASASLVLLGHGR